MTDLTSFLKTDLVDDHVAADVNKLIATALRPEYANTESITATKELTDNDRQFQFITASGANRTVELAPEATSNHITVIYNSGASNNVSVKDDSGATTFIVLGPDEWAIMIPLNAEGWKVYSASALLGTAAPGGRLTLTSGTPVTTADVTGATSVYYCPYISDLITLWDGLTWRSVRFTEQTLAIGTVTSGLPYDVFGYLSAGTLALEKLAWTNGTTRATAVTLQDGRYCKSGDKTRLYLGTFYSTSTTQTEDSGGGTSSQVGGKRFLYNAYNRVRRPIAVHDTTDSWSYTTDTIRQANGAAGNKVEFFLGLALDAVNAELKGTVLIKNNSTQVAKAGVGLDSTSAFSGHVMGGHNAGASDLYSPLGGHYVGIPAVGYHYISWNEKGANSTSTFVGDNAANGVQSGLSVEIWA